MEKKLYYQVDNGDATWTMDLDGVFELIRNEGGEIKTEGDEDDVQWTITPIWMTEAEYDALPEN